MASCGSRGTRRRRLAIKRRAKNSQKSTGMTLLRTVNFPLVRTQNYLVGSFEATCRDSDLNQSAFDSSWCPVITKECFCADGEFCPSSIGGRFETAENDSTFLEAKLLLHPQVYDEVVTLKNIPFCKAT